MAGMGFKKYLSTEIYADVLVTKIQRDSFLIGGTAGLFTQQEMEWHFLWEHNTDENLQVQSKVMF